MDYLESRNRGWERTLILDLPFGASFIHINRETMVPFYEGPNCNPNISYFDGFVASQGFVIVGDENTSSFTLIGALTAHRSLTYLAVHVHQKRLDTVTIRQPSAIEGEPTEEIVSLSGSSWKELLKQYAEKVLSRQERKSFARSLPPVRGYCTWYYSYQNVTESEFLESLHSWRSHSENFVPQYVQIDDGYQCHHGDWLETNTQWPSGLKAIAQSISELGFVPGIWLMPLLASTDSHIFKSKPDWFVRGRDKKTLKIPGWSPPPEDEWVCLDVTREDVRLHLENIFSTLYAWGFRYFKLDGLGLSYPEGLRDDPTETGVSALRTALTIARKAVQESCILSCGAPYLTALGLCDHVRGSGDTGIHWRARGIPGSASRALESWEHLDPTIPCLYNAVIQTLEKWWMFDKWFRVDPDVIIVREERSFLTPGEARISCLAAILTGISFTSDRMDRVSPKRAALLKLASHLRMDDVEPWLPKGSELPSPCFYRGNLGETEAYAILNFGAEKTLWNLSDLGISGEWRDVFRDTAISNGEIVLESHDAALIMAAGEPVFS